MQQSSVAAALPHPSSGWQGVALTCTPTNSDLLRRNGNTPLVLCSYASESMACTLWVSYHPLSTSTMAIVAAVDVVVDPVFENWYPPQVVPQPLLFDL